MELQDISNQINCVENAIDWVKTHLQGDKKEISYSNLVQQRRQLKKIKFALIDNPAAAIYGESQKGKSYLVSSLLSSDKTPFYVIDAKGNKYDFKQDINPLGQNKESTSVVTRFSSNYSWVDDEFPVKVQLLSIVDIILMLSDTYYNDLNNQNVTSKESVIHQLKNYSHYFKGNTNAQNFILEDDILDVQEYFEKHFRSKAFNILGTDYFDVVSKNISNVPIHDWAGVFSLLWNNNPLIIELFKKLIFKLQEIDFVNSLYVPYSAVLRKHGTLLDVDRLTEINSTGLGKEELYKADTEIFYLTNNQEVKKTIKKSFLCALTAELVFKLPDEVKEDKSFLNATDLLDFPGARARLENNESEINEEVVPDMLLRGKVAYLFNKYEDNFKINTLLFCHDKDLASQRFMPSLLNNWVKSTFGATPEEREEFISRTEKSPLFIIATKFNLDLQIIEADRESDIDTLNHRWNQRFSKVLSEELINVNMYDWFMNWTSTNKHFNNIYLLRDYYYSSESQNQLFKGFEKNKKELEVIYPNQYPNFREDLKQSFLRHDFVQRHFNDPSLSWDEATSLNKDGTDLIIKNLTVATKNINNARENRFEKKIVQLKEQLFNELKKHFHSGDSDDLLIKAKETAGRLQAKLAISSGRNPYFFAELISAFMIPESKVYNHFREIMSDLDTKSEIKFNEYVTIRMNVPDINGELDFNTNLTALTKKYEFRDIDSCKRYFEEQNIDLNELFYGNINPLKMFSSELAEQLKEFWVNECKAAKIQDTDIGISKSDRNEILEMLELLFDKLNLTDKIAKNLEAYVDRYDQVDLVQEMIADIAAETINNFVSSVGFNYFSEQDKEEFKTASEKNSLGLILNHEETRLSEFNKDQVGELFENIDNLPNVMKDNPSISSLKMIPSYMNYQRWNDLLKFGFIAVCDIPNYDVKANEQLGVIIEKCELI
jgi:hypothetical protein